MFHVKHPAPLYWSGSDLVLVDPGIVGARVVHDAALAEEDPDLALGALGAVRRVNDVAANRDGVVAADRTRRRLSRLRRAVRRPHDADRVRAFDDHQHRRCRRDVAHQAFVERLALMLAVVLLSRLAGDLLQLHRGDLETAALVAGGDLADQTALDSIRLDDDERAFDVGHVSFSILTRTTLSARFQILFRTAPASGDR